LAVKKSPQPTHVLSLQLIPSVVLGRMGKRLHSVRYRERSGIVRNIQHNKGNEGGEAEARREGTGIDHCHLVDMLAEVAPVPLHDSGDQKETGGESGSLDPHLEESTECVASSLRCGGPDGQMAKSVAEIPGHQGENVPVGRAWAKTSKLECPGTQGRAERDGTKSLGGDGEGGVGISGAGHCPRDMDDLETASEEDLQVCDFADQAVQAFTAGASILHDVISHLVVSEIEEGDALPFVTV
jgi:hypothetical protein